MSRREMVKKYLEEIKKNPPVPKVRYEKGTFMITGSMEGDPSVYDSRPLVSSWIEKIEEIWKPKIPLAARMGNSGRVTFKGVLYKDTGIREIEKIEPSGLDSFDEAATQAMEEFRSSFKLPDDFPGSYGVFYLKFHYNIHSDI